MRFVKLGCAFLCLGYAITAIWPVCLILNQTCHVGHVMPLWLGKLSILTTVLLLGAASYVIHRRKPIDWKIGGGLFGALYFQYVISVLWYTIKLSLPLMPAIAFLCGTAIGTFFFFRWWISQKKYFEDGPQGELIPSLISFFGAGSLLVVEKWSSDRRLL